MCEYFVQFKKIKIKVVLVKTMKMGEVTQFFKYGKTTSVTFM